MKIAPCIICSKPKERRI